MRRITEWLFLMALPGIVGAASVPDRQINLDVNQQQLQRLESLWLQQGASARLVVRPKIGSTWLDLTGITARWEARSSMTTAASYQATSSTTTNALHEIWINLTSAQTGTPITNWIYGVVLISGGLEYPAGTGVLNVVASYFTGGSGTVITATTTADYAGYAGYATNAGWSANSTNTTQLNGQAASYYYQASNPSNYVTATITNGLWNREEGTGWVDTAYYPRSNPSNYITSAGSDTTFTNYFAFTGPGTFTGAVRSGSNTLTQILSDFTGLGLYPSSNPSNYVTSAGSVAYATWAGNATNANSATSATTASYATEARHATNADYSAWAGNATNANSATSATTAGYADYAGYATNAGWSANATNANSATTATTASYASFAGYATNAGWAANATNANSATSATTAGYATSAGYATNAGWSANSTNANSATTATSAGYAGFAGWSTNAGWSANATNATTATSATTAGYATWAGNSTNSTLLENRSASSFASNQVFAGASTTGQVTSAAGDAGKYLRGDGTWQTVAGTGDFLADGTVPMTAPLNLGGFWVTNFTTRIWTNSGVANFTAQATGLVSVTGMKGNCWAFKKPMIYSTNVSFSATAKVSIFDRPTPSLYGCNEMWRNHSVAIASVYNSAAIPLATNVLTVVDATPFSSLTVPWQALILDSTSNECVTVTNVTGSNLYCVWPTRYSHAVSNVVSHACSLNVPGWINDETGANTFWLYLEFASAQTVGLGYNLVYRQEQ